MAKKLKVKKAKVMKNKSSARKMSKQPSVPKMGKMKNIKGKVKYASNLMPG